MILSLRLEKSLQFRFDLVIFNFFVGMDLLNKLLTLQSPTLTLPAAYLS